MKNTKKTSNLKLIIFFVILLILAHITISIVGNGKITSLEGYLYSLAATATDANATASDATSSNAQVTATSGNATSSNAGVVATPCNATSSNVDGEEVILELSYTTMYNTTEDEQINDNTATSCNATSSNVDAATSCNATSANAEDVGDEELQTIETSSTAVAGQKREIVSFLETHKTYVMLIGVCVLAIVVVAIIIIIDKIGIKKRNSKK